MANEEIIITLDLVMGKESATAWGCDLTYDYVRINAEYTT
jgi:glutamate N-acetyltransferase/amino-acid N-acetyltransferase